MEQITRTSRTHTSRKITFHSLLMSIIFFGTLQPNRSFGLANLEAIKYGCQGHDCRGTENEVCVVWSVRSGKAILWWNNQDVTHLVPCEKGHFTSNGGVSCDVDMDLVSSGTKKTTSPIMFVSWHW